MLRQRYVSKRLPAPSRAVAVLTRPEPARAAPGPPCAPAARPGREARAVAAPHRAAVDAAEPRPARRSRTGLATPGRERLRQWHARHGNWASSATSDGGADRVYF